MGWWIGLVVSIVFVALIVAVFYWMMTDDDGKWMNLPRIEPQDKESEGPWGL